MLCAGLGVLDQLTEKHFETKFLSHAAAILEKDFPQALTELDEALSGLTIPITEIVAVGGGETKGTQPRQPLPARRREELSLANWRRRIW